MTEEQYAAESNLLDDVDTDFRIWENTLPGHVSGRGRRVHPRPHMENGLPQGWTVWATYAEFFPNSDRYLVRRPEGDWIVLRHQRNNQITSVIAGAATFLGLYRRIVELPAPPEARQRDWLRAFAARHCDLDDPIEAAEHMVLALGGEMTFIPRALA